VLDIRTLILTTGITSLMLGAIMFFTVRHAVTNSRRALLIWAYGQLVQPFGWFLIAMRQQIPDVFSIVIGNLLVVGGFNACIHALDLFRGRRARHELFIAIIVANFATTVTFVYLYPSALARVVVGSLLFMLSLALVAYGAFAATTPDGRRPVSHWITAGVYAIGIVIIAARIIARLTGEISTPGVAFLSTAMEQVVFAYSSFVNIVGSFGFVLMCNDRFNAELGRLAAEDSLTGVLNRRTFEQHARIAFEDARHASRSLAVLLIDGDHFKRINDEHGHAAGDAALRNYVDKFRGALRSGDALGRIGGEEFAVLLRGCDEREALILGERLRAAVEAHTFQHEGSPVSLRVSVGVAAMIAADTNFETLLRRADNALYSAKNTGRNCVVAASDLTTHPV
jgi:diguanylate cyclase (GGDEF)-like protein